MKITKLLIGGLCTVLLLVACKTTSNTAVATDIEGPTVIQKPVIADLDVGEKRVTGTASGKGTVTEIKDLAILDAVTKAKADVLVEPRFSIEESFNSVTVTVTGYPGTYNNFRPMEPSDTTFVNGEVLSSIKPNKRTTRRNGRNGGKIAAITGGSVAAVVGLAFLWIWLF